MKTKILALFLLILANTACEKIIYDVDNPISGIPTKILMHKGCGSDNQDILPNTLAAAEYGFSLFDGVELDIQYSYDGTLWLDHDNEVYDCDGNPVGCFQELSDDEIQAFAECDGTVRYNTLESVFQLMKSNYPESYISLDIKGQYCEILNTPDIMRHMAESVIELVKKYQLDYHVLIESSSLAFLQTIENQNVIGQCVIDVSGDIDEAIANARYTNARGISLKYGIETFNAEVADLIHKKGYGIMLWYINKPEDIQNAWTAQPDFVQTDNPDFKMYIPAEFR